MSTPPVERQTFGKTLGQIWGLIFLAVLFGMGGYRLMNKAYMLTHGGVIDITTGQLSYPGIPITAFDWFLYGLIILLGVGKAYGIFYRKFVPRSLARCRSALGETGWSMDYLLAPFCMLSLYRPWKIKHAILSWVLIPVMVLLAVTFILWVPNSVFKATVDWAVGGALAFTALLFVFALLRLIVWLAMGAKFEKHPFPASAD